MIEQQLIFVYNANSDLFSTVSDFAHKILSPSTYKCELCALTYGNFAIKQDWKAFIESLPLTTIFLYKDEFEKQYQIEHDLPAVYLRKHEAIEEIISRPEIEGCRSLDKLKILVEQKIKQHVQHHHTDL